MSEKRLKKIEESLQLIDSIKKKQLNEPDRYRVDGSFPSHTHTISSGNTYVTGGFYGYNIVSGAASGTVDDDDADDDLIFGF